MGINNYHLAIKFVFRNVFACKHSQFCQQGKSNLTTKSQLRSRNHCGLFDVFSRRPITHRQIPLECLLLVLSFDLHYWPTQSGRSTQPNCMQPPSGNQDDWAQAVFFTHSKWINTSSYRSKTQLTQQKFISLVWSDKNLACLKHLIQHDITHPRCSAPFWYGRFMTPTNNPHVWFNVHDIVWNHRWPVWKWFRWTCGHDIGSYRALNLAVICEILILFSQRVRGRDLRSVREELR